MVIVELAELNIFPRLSKKAHLTFVSGSLAKFVKTFFRMLSEAVKSIGCSMSIFGSSERTDAFEKFEFVDNKAEDDVGELEPEVFGDLYVDITESKVCVFVTRSTNLDFDIGSILLTIEEAISGSFDAH